MLEQFTMHSKSTLFKIFKQEKIWPGTASLKNVAVPVLLPKYNYLEH